SGYGREYVVAGGHLSGGGAEILDELGYYSDGNSRNPFHGGGQEVVEPGVLEGSPAHQHHRRDLCLLITLKLTLLIKYEEDVVHKNLTKVGVDLTGNK
ncbi:hypothetical protein HAX54_024990, partial [Datura stramonium]|nr:hypothetical protein [Datura stramonium]